MRTLLFMLALVVGSFNAEVLATPQQTTAPAGQTTQGVTNNSTWKNNSGKKVTVTVKPMSNGNLRVTFKDQNGATGTTDNAGPAGGGGVLNSQAVQVGQDQYRVRNGKVQWKGPNGWTDMHQPGFTELATMDL